MNKNEKGIYWAIKGNINLIFLPYKHNIDLLEIEQRDFIL